MKVGYWMKENAINCAVVSSIIGVISAICIYAYKFRVVEYKDFPATAVITGTHYVPGYYGTVTRYDANGNACYDQVLVDPVYGLYYDVYFDGGIYHEYRIVPVTKYRSSRVGDSVSATFRKEWRADGSETYSILVD